MTNDQVASNSPAISESSKIRKRTKTGCLTCRKRRIKCGEERPTCANCVTSKRQCEGYNQRVIFKTPIENWPNHPGHVNSIQYHASMLPGTQKQSWHTDSHSLPISNYDFSAIETNNSGSSNSYADPDFLITSLASPAADLSNSTYSAKSISDAPLKTRLRDQFFAPYGLRNAQNIRDSQNDVVAEVLQGTKELGNQNPHQDSMLYVNPRLLNLTKRHCSCFLETLWLPHLAATHQGIKISVKVQIEQVTKELVDEFKGHREELLPLYRHAADDSLSADELYRNSYQTFQACVWVLDNMTKIKLELRVSLFVRGYAKLSVRQSKGQRGLKLQQKVDPGHVVSFRRGEDEETSKLALWDTEKLGGPEDSDLEKFRQFAASQKESLRGRYNDLLHSEEWRRRKDSHIQKPITSTSAQRQEQGNALIIEKDDLQREAQATSAQSSDLVEDKSLFELQQTEKIEPLKAEQKHLRIQREAFNQQPQDDPLPIDHRWWNSRTDSEPPGKAVDLTIAKSIRRKDAQSLKAGRLQRKSGSSIAQPESLPGTSESAQSFVPVPEDLNTHPISARRNSFKVPFGLDNPLVCVESAPSGGDAERSNASRSRHTVPVPDVSEFDSEKEVGRVHLKPVAQDIPKTLDKHELGTETSGDQMVSRKSATGLLVSDWRMIRLLEDFGHGILVGLRYLEPPLQNGSTRLRWYCKCGHKISGDVMEYREGGISRLIERMERTTGSKIEVTTHSQGTATQKYTFRLPSWIQTSKTSILSTLGHPVRSLSGLPQHRASGATASHAPQATGLQTQQQTLHMMACMQRGRYQRTVHQDRIDDIATDQVLFNFMRKQLAQYRGKVRKLFSLKCIQGMYFVKFRLRAGGSAEVRNHEPCCTSSQPQICECIPPALKVEPSPDAEYRCAPAGPLDTWPPVLSEELMHMLTSPQCINPEENFVLEQLPKRTKGELIGTIGRPAEGWGIHFQEGWDFDLLIGIVLAVFLLASLLFAVLWSHFKLDVQGAFGVSSYMVTASGIFVAWFANRAGKLG